jgi:hypothetical protein
MAKHNCSINDTIKNEYPFIEGVNENVECTLCNAKFCIAHGGRSDIIHMKTKQHKLAIQNRASKNSINNYISVFIDFLSCPFFANCPNFFGKMEMSCFLKKYGNPVLQ